MLIIYPYYIVCSTCEGKDGQSSRAGGEYSLWSDLQQRYTNFIKQKSLQIVFLHKSKCHNETDHFSSYTSYVFSTDNKYLYHYYVTVISNVVYHIELYVSSSTIPYELPSHSIDHYVSKSEQLLGGDILREFSSKRLLGCVRSEHEIWRRPEILNITLNL